MTAPRLPENVKVLTITELTQAVKTVLEDGFRQVWVTGEISNVSRPTSGHIYLKLKDAGAQLNAVLWRGVALRLKYDVRDGMEVIAYGRINVYPPRGEYQLSIEQLQPKGIGELELALRQLKEKLFKLGYFDKQRKRPLPAFPRRVALVTSRSGAAVRDMLEILGRRWPMIEIVVCPVKVQGDGAAEEVAAAIGLLNRLHAGGALPVDVMIVGRGGGSLEDLWAFNEECVAHAIFRSHVPVVSAVGHEVDVTIADFVADKRAATPSEAAELVAPNRTQQLECVDGIRTRLADLVRGQLSHARQRLTLLADGRIFRQPLEPIRLRERRLDETGERLRRAVQQRLGSARTRIEGQAARLQSLSPLNVLARGYSLTRKVAGAAVLRSAEQVQPGEQIETLVQFGRILSRVEEARPAPGPDAPEPIRVPYPPPGGP